MWSPRPGVLGLALAVIVLAACEQNSAEWFPHMKKQPAVQAFEDREGFLPPEGAVDIQGGEAPVSNVIDAASDVLVNPVSPDLRSLQNGKEQYTVYCSTCHGFNMTQADGPVSKVFLGVLPISIAKVRSDGHIYTTIRYGRRRMPGYGRIPSRDRWDIVNYVRYLTGNGDRP